MPTAVSSPVPSVLVKLGTLDVGRVADLRPFLDLAPDPRGRRGRWYSLTALTFNNDGRQRGPRSRRNTPPPRRRPPRCSPDPGSAPRCRGGTETGHTVPPRSVGRRPRPPVELRRRCDPRPPQPVPYDDPGGPRPALREPGSSCMRCGRPSAARSSRPTRRALQPARSGGVPAVTPTSCAARASAPSFRPPSKGWSAPTLCS